MIRVFRPLTKCAMSAQHLTVQQLVSYKQQSVILAILAVCQITTMPINAGDQTTKIQSYKCNKTHIHTVILQFTRVNRMKYDLKVV